MKSNQQEKFRELREHFSFFAFEKYHYTLSERGLDIAFTFNLADQYQFNPTLFIPRHPGFLPDEKIIPVLPGLVFSIGLVELISYWKAACPPRIIIRPHALTDEQVLWWKKLWFHGLGEFFYLNSIPVTIDNFVAVEVASQDVVPPFRARTGPGILVPIGGGKDSAVTLEVLRTGHGVIPLIMNPRKASLETVAAAGISPGDILEIRRTLDPQLIDLNARGFLNGHTPFSALLAFVTVLAAMLTGRRDIALSNESSANESTIEGTDINHQYSKSFAFETDFREYVNRYLTPDVNYFSFLRPLSELQIASVFARFREYHPVFRSCNAGSKTDRWCGKCAKCLFAAIILLPFLPASEVTRIFGRDLMEDPDLVPILDQLTGAAPEKPFDCIGTVDEVNLALGEIIRSHAGGELPLLLRHYSASPAYRPGTPELFLEACTRFDPGHHVEPQFLEILKVSLYG